MKWCRHIGQVDGEWQSRDEHMWSIYQDFFFCPVCGTPRPKSAEKKKWAPGLIIYEGRRPKITFELYCKKEGQLLEVDKCAVGKIVHFIWPAPGFTPVEIPELEEIQP